MFFGSVIDFAYQIIFILVFRNTNNIPNKSNDDIKNIIDNSRVFFLEMIEWDM